MILAIMDSIIQSAAAAYTYYRSLCQEASLERNGKKVIRNKIRRRRERIIRVNYIAK